MTRGWTRCPPTCTSTASCTSTGTSRISSRPGTRSGTRLQRRCLRAAKRRWRTFGATSSRCRPPRVSSRLAGPRGVPTRGSCPSPRGGTYSAPNGTSRGCLTPSVGRTRSRYPRFESQRLRLQTQSTPRSSPRVGTISVICGHTRGGGGCAGTGRRRRAVG